MIRLKEDLYSYTNKMERVVELIFWNLYRAEALIVSKCGRRSQKCVQWLIYGNRAYRIHWSKEQSSLQIFSGVLLMLGTQTAYSYHNYISCCLFISLFVSLGILTNEDRARTSFRTLFDSRIFIVRPTF